MRLGPQVRRVPEPGKLNSPRLLSVFLHQFQKGLGGMR